MLRTLADALRSPISVAAGLVAGLAVFALVVWLPNLGLIWSVTTSGSISIGGRIGFLWSSLGAIGTNFTTFGAAVTTAVAVLFGLNVALATRRARLRLAEAGAGGAAGAGGLLLALVGVGCSSCGAVVLSTLLGTGATASLVAGLPLGGEEFGLASVAVLAATLAYSARRASRPDACAVPGAVRR